MSIYDDARAVASELLAEFKQGVIQYVSLTTVEGESPDEAESTTKGTPVTLNAVARPVSTKYVDNSHIIQSDLQVTIPNDGAATPEMSGFIRIDGSDHKIVEIMARPAAGDPVTWTVIVRR